MNKLMEERQLLVKEYASVTEELTKIRKTIKKETDSNIIGYLESRKRFFEQELKDIDEELKELDLEIKLERDDDK